MQMHMNDGSTALRQIQLRKNELETPEGAPRTFIRSLLRRLAMISVVLIVGALFFWASFTVSPYLRELSAAKSIKSQGGFVEWGYAGPQVVPEGIRGLISVFDRIHRVQLTGRDVSTENLLEVARLPRVQAISIQETRASDAWLDAIQSECLVGLHIGRTNVTDDGMQYIARFNSLRSLNVSDNTAITDQGSRYLMQLKSLRSLILSGVEITDAGVKNIGNLKELVSLDLNRTRVGDMAATEISHLENLQVLGLSRTHLTDLGLQTISSLEQLRELRLNHTPVTDKGLHNLARLNKLKRLEINGTDSTPEGRAKLRVELPDCKIVPFP